ncbi:hypothetical protein CGCSCA1_v002302 [Colletotrichum siamense]|nr:hypothetical protein CGCSCA1_v002302 [Colletotrichum siamense]
MSRLTYSLVALGLAGRAAADGWDDFTNNMATDLAPIISLFGEQATKQYLSESITWLDYFIFAMAPIGILTALVSAIRVCGSSSLRAFIGRAKEGAGSVEVELLSSTSHDVCEIYNSGGITRIFGRPKILEFVHNLDVLNWDPAQTNSTAGISTFQEYVQALPDDGEWEVLHGCRSNFPPEEYAPNLSHNVGIKRLDDTWFALVAVLGFILQGGVLGLAWTATYSLRWEKDGAAPAPYACPMAMAGTALLCIGVFFCAYLVGESTQERIYVRNHHHNNSASRTATVIYWLQPTQVLGEQNFESFCYLDDGGVGSLSRYVSSWKKQKKTSSWTAVFAKAYNKAVERTFLSTHVLSLGSHQETIPKPWKGPIRIAILDQGVDTMNLLCCGTLGAHDTSHGNLITDQKSWVDNSKDIEDTIHGTTVTSLVLRFGPKAEVYVAQVSRKSRVGIEDAGRIVQAIEHARDKWNVDMLVLPFGFRSVDQNIKRLLQDVRQKGKIIMAAAKAIGFNARRSYPANSPHVIGIHAVDGRGKHCEIAPAPVEGDHDFSTLGMGLERSLEGASEMVSGNSYAVCVAAGIAASFLEFARYKLRLDEEDQKWICSTDGMREMLLLMSTKIDGYNFLVPWELFSQRITTDEICEIVLMTIQA